MPVLAQRVTFVGEAGWELYTPTDYLLTLWDLLLDAGRDAGLRPGGYRAIDAMRLEKGYRVWGSDITPETTPDEAGLSFAVAKDMDDRFLGRDALAGRAAGSCRPPALLLVLDDPRLRSAWAPSPYGSTAGHPAASPRAATATVSSAAWWPCIGRGRASGRRNIRGLDRRRGGRAAVRPQVRARAQLEFAGLGGSAPARVQARAATRVANVAAAAGPSERATRYAPANASPIVSTTSTRGAGICDRLAVTTVAPRARVSRVVGAPSAPPARGRCRVRSRPGRHRSP